MNNLHIVVWIGTVLQVLVEFDVEQVQNALEGHLARGHSLVGILRLVGEANFLFKAKLAGRKCTFATPHEYVLSFAEARIVRTLVQVLVRFLATLTVKYIIVFALLPLWVVNLQCHLVDEPRSRLVKPTLHTFFIFALIVNQSLSFGRFAATKIQSFRLGLIGSVFAFIF